MDPGGWPFQFWACHGQAMFVWVELGRLLLLGFVGPSFQGDVKIRSISVNILLKKKIIRGVSKS